MSLRRFINSGLKQVAALASLLVLAGCATSGGSAPVAASQGEVAAESNVVQREVPARAQTLYEQAAAAMSSGDLVDAELRFQEFLLQYPDFPGAHVNLSLIHAANGNDEAARTAVDAALAVDPDYAPALNQSGVLFRKIGKFSEAEAAYLKAVTVHPEYPLAHYNLGVLNELYLQRLDTALQHFQRYQELVGEDKLVGKWIAYLTRRVASQHRTANVTE